MFVARQEITLHDTKNAQCVTSVHITALDKVGQLHQASSVFQQTPKSS